MLKLFLVSFFSLLANAKNIRVNGTVMCGGKTAGNVVVGLYEHNTITKDGKLIIATTDRRGIFDFDESRDELDKPYVRIQHKCNVSHNKCYKEFSLPIVERFIDSKEVYKMTFISLDVFYKEEKEVCQ